MDLKDWSVPILTIFGTIVAGLFGVQTYKRNKSKDGLAETENSVGASYLAQILADLATAKHERDEAMQRAEVNRQLFVAEQRRADINDLEIKKHTYEIERLSRQVSELTATIIKYRPDEKEALSKYSDF